MITDTRPGSLIRFYRNGEPTRHFAVLGDRAYGTQGHYFARWESVSDSGREGDPREFTVGASDPQWRTATESDLRTFLSDRREVAGNSWMRYHA